MLQASVAPWFGLLLLFVGALGVACGSGGTSDGPSVIGNGDGEDEGNGDDGDDEQVEPQRTTAALSGFDLNLKTGTYWQFLLEQTWKSSTTSVVRRFELGEMRETENGPAFRLLYSEPLEEETTSEFRVKWLFYENGKFMASNETTPVSPYVVFDAWEGAWPGATGFFGELSEGGVHEPTQSTFEGESAFDIEWHAISACEVVPGYGQICGNTDPQEQAHSHEYWKPGIGMFGSDWIGCTGDGCLSQKYTLLESSLSGCVAVDPCACNPVGNGYACGENLSDDADPDTLYYCSEGTTAGSVSCPSTCHAGAIGEADHCIGTESDPCKNSSFDGVACGSNLSVPLSATQLSTLYTCENSTTVDSEYCASGCVPAPLGEADHCL